MKTERNIFIAFILNLGFSIFEFIGGIFTGSIAILSDSIHDMGDAMSIGIAYFFEIISNKKPNDKYTFGYKRFSVVGSLITTTILISGSIVVIYNAICRIISPQEIQYNGMILLAVIGVCVNFVAAIFTHGGHSMNEKAVNLHMLEDVFGWIVVLIGAVVIRFTDFVFIDPILSVCVAVFIFVHAVKHLIEAFDILVEKAPHAVSVSEIRECVLAIDGVIDLKELRVWSLDGVDNYCVMKVECEKVGFDITKRIREAVLKLGVENLTIEIVKGDSVKRYIGKLLCNKTQKDISEVENSFNK